MFTNEKIKEIKLTLLDMNNEFRDDIMNIMTGEDWREISALNYNKDYESDYFTETMLKAFYRLEYLKENYHKLNFVSGISVDHCDFSGHLQLRVEKTSYNSTVNDIFNHDYTIRYVLEYQFRKDTRATPEDISKIFYHLIEAREDVEDDMPFIEDPDEKYDEKYDELLTKKLLENADYVSCYVKLFYYLKSMRLVDRHTKSEVKDFDLLLTHVLKTIPKTVEFEESENPRFFTNNKTINFKNMFKLKEGNWFSEQDFEFLSYHKISIVVKSYDEKSSLIKKSTFNYDDELKVYKHTFKQKESGRCYGYDYQDEIHFKSHREINELIDSVEKNRLFKISFK